MNDCCAHLFREAKKELEIKDKRIAFLESEVTRVFEPTRKFWNEELETKLAIAVEALEFYSKGYALDVDDSFIAHFEYGHMRISTGKKANEALKEIKEESE